MGTNMDSERGSQSSQIRAQADVIRCLRRNLELERERSRRNEIEMVDTIHECLLAVGGSSDLSALEQQIQDAGWFPSDFIRRQIQQVATGMIELPSDNRKL